jgi:adenosine deaminase
MNIKQIPKVELHFHLEGSIRLDTLWDISQVYGPKFGLPTMTKEQARDYFCITEKVPTLTEFIQKFLNTQALLCSYEIMERIAFEACEDTFRNGVVLLEIRYSPDFVVDTFQVDHSHMTMDGVHSAVLKGIERARQVYDIQVGLIGIFDRSRDLPHAQIMLDFYKKHRNDFVGIDVANDELYPLDPFAHCLRELKSLGLHLTIHAGEAGPPSNILQAIRLGAERIGHGIRILEDTKVIEFAKQHNVLLEVCPTSNSRTGVVQSYEAHPVRELLEKGLLISISTDDCGIFDSNIIEEYELLRDTFGFTMDEFQAMNLNALHASFLPNDVKSTVFKKYFNKE